MITPKNETSHSHFKDLVILYHNSAQEYEQLNNLSKKLLYGSKLSQVDIISYQEELQKIFWKKDAKHKEMIQHLVDIVNHPKFRKLELDQQLYILNIYKFQPTNSK